MALGDKVKAAQEKLWESRLGQKVAGLGTEEGRKEVGEEFGSGVREAAIERTPLTGYPSRGAQQVLEPLYGEWKGGELGKDSWMRVPGETYDAVLDPAMAELEAGGPTSADVEEQAAAAMRAETQATEALARRAALQGMGTGFSGEQAEAQRELMADLGEDARIAYMQAQQALDAQWAERKSELEKLLMTASKEGLKAPERTLGIGGGIAKTILGGMK